MLTVPPPDLLSSLAVAPTQIKIHTTVNLSPTKTNNSPSDVDPVRDTSLIYWGAVDSGRSCRHAETFEAGGFIQNAAEKYLQDTYSKNLSRETEKKRGEKQRREEMLRKRLVKKDIDIALRTRKRRRTICWRRGTPRIPKCWRVQFAISNAPVEKPWVCKFAAGRVRSVCAKQSWPTSFDS